MYKRNSRILPIIAIVKASLSILFYLFLLVFVKVVISDNTDAYQLTEADLTMFNITSIIYIVVLSVGIILTVVAMVQDSKNSNVLNLIAAIVFIFTSFISTILLFIHYIKSKTFYDDREMTEKIMNDEFTQID